MALDNDTKYLRKQFRTKYSLTTQRILEGVAAGKTNVQVADRAGVSPETVVTTKGNLTRGFYAPYCYRSGGKVVGACQF